MPNKMLIKGVIRVCSQADCKKSFKCYGDCKKSSRLQCLNYCTCPECVEKKMSQFKIDARYDYHMCRVRKEKTEIWSVS